MTPWRPARRSPRFARSPDTVTIVDSRWPLPHPVSAAAGHIGAPASALDLWDVLRFAPIRPVVENAGEW